MTLADVKEYLGVDDDADDTLIQSCIDTAEDYIASAVGKYDDTNPKAQTLCKALVQDFYDHRELMHSVARQRMGFVYRSIIMQLQLELEEEE
jgi:uncharacterized phage protein (predicted DNA packaging)